MIKLRIEIIIFKKLYRIYLFEFSKESASFTRESRTDGFSKISIISFSSGISIIIPVIFPIVSTLKLSPVLLRISWMELKTLSPKKSFFSYSVVYALYFS